MVRCLIKKTGNRLWQEGSGFLMWNNPPKSDQPLTKYDTSNWRAMIWSTCSGFQVLCFHKHQENLFCLKLLIPIRIQIGTRTIYLSKINFVPQKFMNCYICVTFTLKKSHIYHKLKLYQPWHIYPKIFLVTLKILNLYLYDTCTLHQSSVN